MVGLYRANRRLITDTLSLPVPHLAACMPIVYRSKNKVDPDEDLKCVLSDKSLHVMILNLAKCIVQAFKAREYFINNAQGLAGITT